MEWLYEKVVTSSARHRTKLWSVVIVIAIALVAAALGEPYAAATSRNAKSISHKHLTNLSFIFNFTPYGQEASYYYAEALGYYKEEGINLQINQGKASTTAVTDVAAGADEVGVAAPSAVAAGVEDGQKVVAVATPNGTGSFGIFIAKSTGITSVKGLAGHTVIAPAGYSSSMLSVVLKAAGVNPTSVKEDIVAGTALLTAYASGIGTAMITQIPFANPLVQPKRPSYTFLWSKFGVTVPDFSLITTPSFLATHRAIVSGFVKASLEGVLASLKNPSAATAALLASQPTLNKSIAKSQLTGVLHSSLLCPPHPTGQHPYGYQPPSNWSSMLSLLVKYDLVGGETYPASDLYTNTFFTGSHAIKVAKCPLSKVK